MKRLILISLLLVNSVLTVSNYCNTRSINKVSQSDSLSYYKFENELLKDELNRLEIHINRIKEIAGVEGKFDWRAKVINPIDTRKLLKNGK